MDLQSFGELCDPCTCDPARLPDLDTAKLPSADKVVGLVATNMQNVRRLLDCDEPLTMSGVGRRSGKGGAGASRVTPRGSDASQVSADLNIGD
jgi:hypothetical protein